MAKDKSLLRAVILQLRGLSVREIAKRLNVSKSSVALVLKSEPTLPAPETPEPAIVETQEPVESAPVSEAPSAEIFPEAPPVNPFKVPANPLDGLAALLSAGANATRPEPPAVVPVSVAEPVEPQAADPANDDERPIDWNEEQRTDLWPRSPGRIRFLLKFESPRQTQARITNDKVRAWLQRGYSPRV
jgi:transcriptional regulator with XRE-family HTH domain